MFYVKQSNKYASFRDKFNIIKINLNSNKASLNIYGSFAYKTTTNKIKTIYNSNREVIQHKYQTIV